MSAQKVLKQRLDIPSLFKQLLALPVVTRAQFVPSIGSTAIVGNASSAAAASSSPSAPSVPNFPSVWLTQQIKDPTLDETRTLQQLYQYSTSQNKYAPIGYPTQLDTFYTMPSPSKKLVASFRIAPSKTPPAKGTPPNYVIDIVDSDPASPTVGRVLYCLPATNHMHGRIFPPGGQFGGVCWNRKEDALVYMAEAKAEDRKAAGYFPLPEDEEKQKLKPDVSIVKGTEWEAKEDWGEQMVNVIKPRPFVLKFDQDNGVRLFKVRGIPESFSAGQAIWSGWNESTYAGASVSATSAPLASPTAPAPPAFDEGLYITAYPNNQDGGRRLGIQFYNSRESGIVYLPASCIIDPKSQPEKSKEKSKEEVAKEIVSSPTDVDDLQSKLESLSVKRKEELDEKLENRMIWLTPSDHSAQNPRLDGYEVPQLIYTTTDKVWHHGSGSKLKTFITLPSTLSQFVKLVQAPIEKCVTTAVLFEDQTGNAPPGIAQEYPLAASDASPSSPASASQSPAFRSPWYGMKFFPSNTHEMIPIVRQPKSINAFPGLWPANNALPGQHAFIFDEKHILIASGWRSQTVLLMCCDEDDSLTRFPLPIDAPFGASMNLYDVDRATGKLIVGVSALNQPESLYIAEVRVLEQGQTVSVGEDFLPICVVHKDGSFVSSEEEDDAYAQVKFTPLLKSAEPLHQEAAKRLQECSMEIIQVDVPAEEKYPDGGAQLPFEAVLVTPRIDTTKPLPPLFVFPHGGPHGVSTTAWINQAAFYPAAGASVLYINYRGSTAFGQDMLETLPGKCGTQDVKDCIRAVEAVLNRKGTAAVADVKNIHIQGGSHGGFLTTHLIGQYPTMFQTAIARNPVCNIAHMVATSDIPDWCMFEATGQYEPRRMPTPQEYDIMFRASPIAHIDRVQTPLLMLLGGVDRRVPVSQALDYVKLLRSRGVRTRTLLYPEGQHSIAETAGMEGDVWVSMMMWALKRYDGLDFSLPNSTQE